MSMQAIVFVAFVIVIMMAILGPPETEPDSCKMYHEMRAIYEQSQGEFGWPRGAIRGCEE